MFETQMVTRVLRAFFLMKYCRNCFKTNYIKITDICVKNILTEVREYIEKKRITQRSTIHSGQISLKIC